MTTFCSALSSIHLNPLVYYNQEAKAVKKIKAILIVIILSGLICIYHENIIDFINTLNLPFSQNIADNDIPEINRNSYEYYFKPYVEN